MRFRLNGPFQPGVKLDFGHFEDAHVVSADENELQLLEIALGQGDALPDVKPGLE